MSNSPRVFISRTSEFERFPEKKSFILAAIDGVNRARCQPCDMRYFTARDEKPAEYCKSEVRQCDVYVGIIGLRYGSPVRDRPEVSYTELEFEAAGEFGKKRFVFLLDPMSEVPAALFTDPKHHDRQEAFRKRINDCGITCAQFTNRDELEKLIYQALKENFGPENDLIEPARIEWPDGKPPYPGLLSFDQEYADLFFGRDREVDAIIARMSEPQGRCLIISGASGSGKSSVVGAGLWRALVREDRIPGSRVWEWLQINPGRGRKSSPFEALAEGLIKKRSLGIAQQPESLARKLRIKPECWGESLAPQFTGDRELLLFIDQLEELFTAGYTGEDIGSFLEQLVACACDKKNRLRIVATVRSEFIAQLEESESVRALLNNGYNYHLGPVSPRVLQDMIEKPAVATGYDFEPGLVEKILHEAAQEPGSLPLVAYTLRQLFERRRDRTLTGDAYKAIGGVAGAIGTQADQQIDALDSEALSAFDRVFAELVHIERERPPTRKLVRRAHFNSDGAANRLIDALAGENCRVLVTGGDGGEISVEVAHEKLFSAWPRLDTWIKNGGDALRLIEYAEEAARRWHERGEIPKELWDGTAAAEALNALRRFGKKASPALDRFLKPHQLLEERIRHDSISHAERALIGRILAEFGDHRRGVGLCEHGLPDIDWVEIPAGEVKLEDVESIFKVKRFRIAKYLVTNAQFAAFITAEDGYKHEEWWNGIPQQPPESPAWVEPNSPRETVSWFEAVAFCGWLTERYRERGLLGKEQAIRLPTEWEWQLAATGGDPEREYPWSGGWDASRCNSSESRLNRTTAVGMYPSGASVNGVLDMAGNVWEWCLNKYEEPANPDSLRIDKDDGQRVVRGGSWNIEPGVLRASYRVRDDADIRVDLIGFRLAQDID